MKTVRKKLTTTKEDRYIILRGGGAFMWGSGTPEKGGDCTGAPETDSLTEEGLKSRKK